MRAGAGDKNRAVITSYHGLYGPSTVSGSQTVTAQPRRGAADLHVQIVRTADAARDVTFCELTLWLGGVPAAAIPPSGTSKATT